jgi:hypothetical protein
LAPLPSRPPSQKCALRVFLRASAPPRQVASLKVHVSQGASGSVMCSNVEWTNGNNSREPKIHKRVFSVASDGVPRRHFFYGALLGNYILDILR